LKKVERGGGFHKNKRSLQRTGEKNGNKGKKHSAEKAKKNLPGLNDLTGRVSKQKETESWSSKGGKTRNKMGSREICTDVDEKREKRLNDHSPKRNQLATEVCILRGAKRCHSPINQARLGTGRKVISRNLQRRSAPCPSPLLKGPED